MDWRHEAACRDEDPELFFPIGNTGPAMVQIEEAKAVCRRCDVVDECLRWALETGQDAGVWGGLSEDERRALKRRNARAPRPEQRLAPLVRTLDGHADPYLGAAGCPAQVAAFRAGHRAPTTARCSGPAPLVRIEACRAALPRHH